MKKILILFLFIAPLMVEAQQLKIYTDSDGYNYFALYAYGLPREVVKTNQEIKDSKFGDTGIMRRHHTTKYDDAGIGSEGYNANQKLSFAFLIAPYNVDANGDPIMPGMYQSEISWYDASGWDVSIDTELKPDPWGVMRLSSCLKTESVAKASPTGCAAYQGLSGEDTPGTWRLPTQREALVMFTIMEHALTMQGANEVPNLIINGKYWTSTELKTSANWKVWYVDSTEGKVIHSEKLDAASNYPGAFARCVRDIDNDPINE